MSKKSVRNAIRTAKRVIREPKLDIDKYPTRYMPNVGRQVMADGGNPVAPQQPQPPQPQPNQLGLYSHGAYAAANLPQAKGTPQQYRAMLEKQGVKPDEFMHTGWDDAFANRPSVTREEVAQHFADKSVPLTETKLAGNTIVPMFSEQAKIDLAHEIDSNEELLNKIIEEYPQVLEYEDWGGDTADYLYTNFPDVLEDYISKQHGVEYGVRDITKYGDKTIPDGQNYRELLLKLDTPENKFQSRHWGDPNVLAHLRMSDREGPNGEKLLHVEEIQSDWAQEGRKKGFNDASSKATLQRSKDAMRDARDAYNKASDNMEAKFAELRRSGVDYLEIQRNPELLSLENIRNELWRNVVAARDALAKVGNVPLAPFVDKTDKWTDLALKRVFSEAAKGGYEGIAFTPGQEHADRYDLSKHVSKVQYFPTTQNLKAFDKNGKVILDKRDVLPDKIPDHVGRDVANRLLSDEHAVPNRFGEGILVHEMRGQDLSIGGEGMKSFYDKIVPTQAEKLAKKLDKSARIQKHALGVHPDHYKLHYLPVTNEMREKIQRGLPMFADGGEVEATGHSEIAPPDHREAPRAGETSFAGTDIADHVGDVSETVSSGSRVMSREGDSSTPPLSSDNTPFSPVPSLFFSNLPKKKIKTNQPDRFGDSKENPSVRKALVLTSPVLRGRAGRGTPR
jgi:hypothetical protein